MCGRFGIDASWEELRAYYALLPSADTGPELVPRYNIAPSQPILVIVNDELGARSTLLARWGLIPSWVKDPDSFTLLANARSETASQKPSFKNAIRHRRILIPASGFYEWKRFGKGVPSQPYWVPPKKGGLVSFGGLMETWLGADGSEIDTACILTTDTNSTFSQIHHRLPLVIQPEDFDSWLNCKEHQPKDISNLLKPVNDNYFEAIPVRRDVNKVSNNSSKIQEAIDLIDAEHQGAENKQLSMFSD